MEITSVVDAQETNKQVGLAYRRFSEKVGVRKIQFDEESLEEHFACVWGDDGRVYVEEKEEWGGEDGDNLDLIELIIGTERKKTYVVGTGWMVFCNIEDTLFFNDVSKCWVFVADIMRLDGKKIRFGYHIEGTKVDKYVLIGELLEELSKIGEVSNTVIYYNSLAQKDDSILNSVGVTKGSGVKKIDLNEASHYKTHDLYVRESSVEYYTNERVENGNGIVLKRLRVGEFVIGRSGEIDNKGLGLFMKIDYFEADERFDKRDFGEAWPEGKLDKKGLREKTNSLRERGFEEITPRISLSRTRFGEGALFKTVKEKDEKVEAKRVLEELEELSGRKLQMEVIVETFEQNQQHLRIYVREKYGKAALGEVASKLRRHLGGKYLLHKGEDGYLDDRKCWVIEALETGDVVRARVEFEQQGDKWSPEEMDFLESWLFDEDNLSTRQSIKKWREMDE